MNTKADVWNNAVEAMQAYTPFYQQEAVQKIENAHARNVWFILLLARGAEPQLFSLDYFQTINPYSSPARLKEQIAEAAEQGYLRKHEADSYHLTAKGKSVLDAFFDTAHVLLSQAPALPDSEMNQLTAYLARIVFATEASPQPANKSTLASSRWTDPGSRAAPSLQIDQYITDLLRFRDDAHRAAWQPTGLSGLDWETLTFVWNDEAHTAAELAENLERRGYSETDYKAALDRLVKRHVLKKVDGRYHMTDKGQQLRDTAEDETNRLFYLGWSVLDDDELKEMDRLLQELTTLLKESVVAEPVAA